MTRFVKPFLLTLAIIISINILINAPAKITTFFWLAFMWAIGFLIYKYRTKISNFIFVKAEYETDETPKPQPERRSQPKSPPSGSTSSKRSSLTVDEEEIWNNLTSSMGYENYDPPIPFEDMNPLNLFKKRKNKKK